MKGSQHHQSHQSERQQLLLQKLREAWKESEWRLMFLRSHQGKELPQTTQEEIIKWAEAT